MKTFLITLLLMGMMGACSAEWVPVHEEYGDKVYFDNDTVRYVDDKDTYFAICRIDFGDRSSLMLDAKPEFKGSRQVLMEVFIKPEIKKALIARMEYMDKKGNVIYSGDEQYSFGYTDGSFDRLGDSIATYARNNEQLLQIIKNKKEKK